jgi:hypothetical protein
VNDCMTDSWLFELLEEGYSDRGAETKPMIPELSPAGMTLEQVAHAEASIEIHEQLKDLIAACDEPMAMLMALENALLGIVKDMGSPKGLGSFAHVLRDNPDKFPMFPTIEKQRPSMESVRSCHDTVQCFVSEKRDVEPGVIFNAFLSPYAFLGAHIIGALELAGRIEDWAPEQQEKVRQAGLRSIYELPGESDHEEWSDFFALWAERYPLVIFGVRDIAGDVFVSGPRAMLICPEPDYLTAIERIKQDGASELILGPEAEGLFAKMDALKAGSTPHANHKIH